MGIGSRRLVKLLQVEIRTCVSTGSDAHTQVLLKFDRSVHQRHINGSSYTIRFHAPDGPFRFLLLGLEAAAVQPPMVLQPTIPQSAVEQTMVRSNPSNTPVQPLALAKRELNPEQQAAVRAVLAGCGAPLPYIIFGPPGTGKTSTLVETIYQVLKTEPSARVLVSAPSNDAVDVISSRLLQYRPKSEVGTPKCRTKCRWSSALPPHYRGRVEWISGLRGAIRAQQVCLRLTPPCFC